MEEEVNTNKEYEPVRDRLPVTTKVSYGRG